MSRELKGIVDVEPEVFLVAHTQINDSRFEDALDSLGVDYWVTDAIDDADYLTEFAGRLCYKSFGTELNPNITKVRSGNRGYISNVLKQHHGSVLEHSSATVLFRNVSRVFTHEMVRHRVASFSQESGRYVVPTEVGMWTPDSVKSHGKCSSQPIGDEFEDLVDQMNEIAKLDDMSFSEKKKMTSVGRRFLPNGMATDLLMTTNHREWRHILEVRSHPGAEEEMRFVMQQLGPILSNIAPNCYQDMVADVEDGYVKFTFEHSKV